MQDCILGQRVKARTAAGSAATQLRSSSSRPRSARMPNPSIRRCETTSRTTSRPLPSSGPFADPAAPGQRSSGAIRRRKCQAASCAAGLDGDAGCVFEGAGSRQMKALRESRVEQRRRWNSRTDGLGSWIIDGLDVILQRIATMGPGRASPSRQADGPHTLGGGSPGRTCPTVRFMEATVFNYDRIQLGCACGLR